MPVLPLQYALWQDLADCVSAMVFAQHDQQGAPLVWWSRYDAFGDLRRADLVTPNNGVTFSSRFDYDAFGRLYTTELNPRPGLPGMLTRYIWADADLIRSEAPDRVTWTEWAEGRRTVESNFEAGQWSWTVFWHDPQGLLTREQHIAPDGETWELHEYDALGRLIKTSLASTLTDSARREVTRGYDDFGRLAWKDADNDGDGAVDTTSTWHWWCPG